MGGTNYRSLYGIQATPSENSNPRPASGSFASLRITPSDTKTVYTYYIEHVADKGGLWTEVHFNTRMHQSVKKADVRINVRNSSNICVCDLVPDEAKDDKFVFKILDNHIPRDTDVRVDLTVTEVTATNDDDKDNIWLEIGKMELHYS